MAKGSHHPRVQLEGRGSVDADAAFAQIYPGKTEAELYDTFAAMFASAAGGKKVPLQLKICFYGDRKSVSAVEVAVTSKQPWACAEYELHFPQGECHLGEMTLSSRLQGRGLARDFVTHAVEVARANGLGALCTDAGAADMVSGPVKHDLGAYAWARYGFAPSQKSWDRLRADIGESLLTAEEIHRRGMDNEYQPFLKSASDAKFAIFTSHLTQKPKSYTLSKADYDVVTTILRDPDPQAIWVLSDLGAVIAKAGKQELTLGKLMLAGREWEGGRIDLTRPNPGLERLTQYLATARDRPKQTEVGG